MRIKLPAFLSLLCFLAVACGASSGEDAKTPTVTDCGQHARPARDKVEAAVEVNVACTSDGDCVTVAITSACFDACSTAIAKSGRDAVEQAMRSASENECKEFAAAGCKVIAPPCVPPTPPRCRDGKCG